MATILKTSGLQHAHSVGNLGLSAHHQHSGHSHLSGRSYESDDENMGRRKTRSIGQGLQPRTSIYSKGDIREQYCLSDRQLSRIERPRRDGFFGCWSGRGTPQSILNVCVGRRNNTSDENLSDYAPFYKYPRCGKQTNEAQYDDDLENSYFRRRPTSFLCSGDPKRYTWLAADEDGVRLEGPRSIRPDGIDDTNKGPYVVSSYPAYLSQSSEHIASSYRCPAHIDTQTVTVPPTISDAQPRTKHVSFARSHTLTSFDEASVIRSTTRLATTKSQERLIGGKKPSIILHGTPSASTLQQPTIQVLAAQSHAIQYHHHHHQHVRQPMQVLAVSQTPTPPPSQIHLSSSSLLCQQQQQQQHIPESLPFEKIKRGSMKTQATQTGVYVKQKSTANSPHLAHRVSNTTQANGMMSARKLTKSLSEAIAGRKVSINGESVVPSSNILFDHHFHEPLQRTQSEEPSRLHYDIGPEQHHKGVCTHFDNYSRTSSRQSDLDTSRSDIQFSEHMLISHSRNHSQDSATSHRSIDFASDELNIGGAVDGINHSGCINFMDKLINRSYESNSLPRRKCMYHTSDDYQTNSLPRHDASHQLRQAYEQHTADSYRQNAHRLRTHGTFSLESSMGSNQNLTDTFKRRYSCGVQDTMRYMHDANDNNQSSQCILRRNSINTFFHSPSRDEDDDDDEANAAVMPADEMNESSSESSEYCSTCESSDSEDDTKQEKEIFIDFKPRLSPVRIQKRLQHTVSDGEMMYDKRRASLAHDAVGIAVRANNGDHPRTMNNAQRNNNNEYNDYCNLPIRNDGGRGRNNLLKLPTETDRSVHHRREAFRKRSISLEEPGVDEMSGMDVGDRISIVKSGPPSPSAIEKSEKDISTFPSSDSLANDLTRDHSDGNWNESQATVLQIDGSAVEMTPALLTPTTKRKNLLLQHLQRSSMDTDALEMEDHFNDQTTNHSQRRHTEYAIGVMPSIAVIPSPGSGDDIDDGHATIQRKPKPKMTTARTDVRRKSAEPIVHIYSNVQTEMARYTPIAKSSSDQQPFTQSDGTRTNTTDISEGSTNTEDYVTCTDASKRGTKPPSASSSSTTQLPVATKSSQTITQDGSSFESASSMYSLARVDAICDEGTSIAVLHEDTLPLPPKPSTKASPSHSVSSSSSGSFCLPPGAKKPVKGISTSPRNSLPTVVISVKPKTESISEDDKSEKRYSSSGYYESPHDDEPSRPRRSREWNEEERRRRKEKMRLDIEKENIKSITSPTRALASAQKSVPVFKQISPDDRTALNTLDGANGSKSKRIRPKTRRSPRVRNDDTLPRKAKTPIMISPEHAELMEPPMTRVTPTKYQQPRPPTTYNIPTHSICKRAMTASPENRLKAMSAESLRSVSPGSDSVFYSEADVIIDHQVHCHHCGKEVEIINVDDGSHEDIHDEANQPNIVKPPADFADSPDGPRTPHHPGRLYKKMDKRFRSEERHGDRRHYRNRQDNARAKSEERGKEDSNKERFLRPAGSSPCVVVEGGFNVRDQVADPEQGIYHGFYRLGTWICITDRDVWRRSDSILQDERSRELSDRRLSTESEKDFRKKYQAITHRLVHRKSCVEMYRRQNSNSFKKLSSSPAKSDSLRFQLEEIVKQMLLVWAKQGIALNVVSGEKNGTDKTIIVRRESGEFGFRIHGSKPVVVSAIEPETPAETSGLEVGDIVLAVNGVSVVDKTHSEVVKIAHAGSDILELEVARTIGLLSSETTEASSPSLYSGYLWRQCSQNNQKWVRRWFCLRPDHCLYYYKTDQDIQPVGAILLTNHIVENCSADVGRAFAFRISSHESSPLYLAADTEEAANRWVAVTSHASKQSDPWLEISTRNLRLPPNGVPRPDCFGYLLKLGNRWRAWSKRYCVLKDACLYFYHDANSKSAFGMACLQGYRVQPTNNTAGKKFAFEVAPPEPKLRHYYFSTESDMDKKRWVAALEYSIDRWMKAT